MDRRMSVMQRRSRLANEEQGEEESVERSNSNRSEMAWYITT